MKCQITRFVRTLNTCSGFVANVTHELPPGLGNPIHPVNGLHEDVIRHIGLRDPQSAQQVSPTAVGSLFQCAAFIGTEDTLRRIPWGDMTDST